MKKILYVAKNIDKTTDNKNRETFHVDYAVQNENGAIKVIDKRFTDFGGAWLFHFMLSRLTGTRI